VELATSGGQSPQQVTDAQGYQDSDNGLFLDHVAKPGGLLLRLVGGLVRRRLPPSLCRRLYC
jgi:hypothetical protein